MQFSQVFKDKLWDVFSSGFPRDYDLDILRKVLLVNLIILSGFIFITLLGVIAFFQNDIALFVADFTALALLIVVFFHLRRTKRIYFAANIGILITGFFFLYLFATGGVDNSAFVWSFCYPVISLFLLGNSLGTVVSIIYLILICLAYWLGPYISFLTTYNPNLFIRIVPSYIAIYIFSYFMERVREIVQLRFHKANVDLEETNKELIEANQLKEDLFHITVHELRNPLNVILGSTQFLQDQMCAKESRDKFLSLVESSSNDMILKINDLLKTATIENPKFVLNIEEMDLSVELSGQIDELSIYAKSKNQFIRFVCPAGIKIQADINRIKEVFENLVSNAIKYSPADSEISVFVNDEPDSVLLQVSDEGVGFDEDDKVKMFEKFQKLSAKPTAGEASTGLGLYIVKSLVEMHHGTVWVESEEGKGASFFIHLPKNMSN